MRKLIHILISGYLIAVFAIWPVYAGTCVASKNGCWADVTVWGTSCNGVSNAVPVAGDDVQLAGYIVTAIGNVTTDCTGSPSVTIPATGSLGTVTSAGTAGQISYDLSDAACHGDETCTFTATTVTGGTAPATFGMIYTTGAAAADHILGIHANIVGGSAATARGVYHNSTGGVHITGTVTGGTGTGAENVTTGTMTITGNITGAANTAVKNFAAGAVDIVGHVKGGTSASAYGLNNNSTGAVTISNGAEGSSAAHSYGVYTASTGAIAITGDITGGAGSDAAGIDNYGGATVTLTTSNLINGAGGVAFSGKPPVWTAGTTYYLKWYSGAGPLAAPDHYFWESDSATYPTAGGGGAWGF